MGQMVLSMLMQNCAGMLESGALYRELAEHNQRLEQTVAQRTIELRRASLPRQRIGRRETCSC